MWSLIKINVGTCAVGECVAATIMRSLAVIPIAFVIMYIYYIVSYLCTYYTRDITYCFAFVF